ncbi:hypothetical protein FB446DRAFT_791800 [Lentinula raphanica]|nr:hypothetical protein FB446DRAFT_791800 [Lentinula raphanica]
MVFRSEPLSKVIRLPLRAGEEPEDVQAVLVPLPKDTTGTVFGQRIAEYPQRFNTYLLDSNDFVVNPQAVWDAPTASSQFAITNINPSGFALDNRALFVGPFNDDHFIAVVCTHKKPGSGEYISSTSQYSFNSFKIQGKNAMSFTMVNAEDGGDSDFHDTVVGVAVTYTKK